MSGKILIVDDIKSQQDFLRDVLESEGYRVMVASSGEMAIDMCRQYKPDIVLLDVVLPGMDGYQVCRHLRMEPGVKSMKIIMVSVKNQLNEKLEGYTKGADDYLCKPFEKEELIAKVRVFLRLKSVEDQLEKLNETLDEQVRTRTNQLIDSEKMASLGRHTAGIVHNLNNPLGILLAASELLNIKYPDEKLIITVRKAASQMRRIISTILETTHRENKSERTELVLNNILQDQVELMKADPFFRHKIQTELKLENIPRITGVYSDFSQTFANLISNAIDAMRNSETRLLVISSGVEKNNIIIHFSDSGEGISRENLGKIFDPFFSTREHNLAEGRSTGTGLGLSFCREMIHSYGGKIRVESTKGIGTTFSILLPLKKKQ